MKSFIYILLAVWALGFCEWAIGEEIQEWPKTDAPTCVEYCEEK